MTSLDDSRVPENTLASDSPWKPTPFGEWAWYDKAIEDDPSLLEILKPEDGYKGFSNEFKFKVKINTNGSIVVFRSNRLSKSMNDSYNDQKQSNRFKDFSSKNGLSINQVQVDNFQEKQGEYKNDKV